MQATTKAAILTAALGAAILAATRADTITGSIKLSPNLTHEGAGTASDLTETISDVWKWAGTSATIGTQGLATALTKMYVTTSNGIPAGATNQVDLYGALYDSFGNLFQPTKVKGFIFCPTNSLNVASNGYQSMLIRPGSANGWATWMSTTTSAIRVYATGMFALFAPTTNAYAVTATTGDILETVNESTNACGYRLFIFAE
jgi:hypothetical protein